MNNSPIDRSTLKSYFVKNAVPTQQQFSEMIDSVINLADDGLIKHSDTSLSVQAANGTEQSVLELYRDFLTRKPVWRYLLNPLRSANDSNSSHPGLALRDDKARLRLYLQEDKALAGMGTIDPKAALQVVPDMTVLRTVDHGNGPVQEDWTYLGLANDQKIALELGENGPGKIGSLKLNGSVSNEFSFVRPGQGSLYLDTTGGDFYINYDENVRRSKSSTLHMAAADGSENIRLATQGASWLLGGKLGLGINAPESALHITVSGATGDDFNALDGKIALQLGDASSKGSLLIRGGSTNDRSFVHAHGGQFHLDASSGQYLLNRGDVSTGTPGLLSLGNAIGDEAVRFHSESAGFTQQPFSIGGNDNEAFLHLHVPNQADLSGKVGGIKIETGDAGTLTITGDSIDSDRPLRLQPNGGIISFGGSLDVEETLSFDQDEFPDHYFISRNSSEQNLNLAGFDGVSLQSTSPAPPDGFKALLHFNNDAHHMFLGMDADHLRFETANGRHPLGLMKDGQVLINQSKPLGSPLALRGRMDITGLNSYAAYGNHWDIEEWLDTQNSGRPAQVVLSSQQSELAVAIVEEGSTSSITQAVFNETDGYASRYQMEIMGHEPGVMRWTYREGEVLNSWGVSPPAVDEQWRALQLDADKQRVGIGRGEPLAALDIEGTGTPNYGVQLLVRESETAGPNAPQSSSGVTIGFASPHFSHPNLLGYDSWDIDQETSNLLSLGPDYHPVLTYIGLRDSHIGPQQNTGTPRMEVASLYDLPIDLRINEARLIHLTANDIEGKVEIGVANAEREPGDIPVTFLVNVPAQMDESLALNQGLEVSGGVANFNSGATVNGLADLKNDLKVAGVLTANGEARLFNGLSVTGVSTLNGNVTAVGKFTASGPLEASQAANLKSGVTVDGTSTLNGNAVVTGMFTVHSGITNLNAPTNINAALTVTEVASFTKPLTSSGLLSANAGANVAQGLTVTGSTSLAEASTSGAFTANGSTNLKGITTAEAAFKAREAATFDKTLTVTGKLTANGTAEFKEKASFKKGTDVEGPSALSGLVTVSQDPGLPDFSPDDAMLQVNGLAQVRFAKVEEDLQVEGSFIQVGSGELTLPGSDQEWFPVSISNESGRPALLEVEIWKDNDFYTKLRLFPAASSSRLAYREIEVFQDRTRYVADFAASASAPLHAVWLKGGTTYRFRTSDKAFLNPGLQGDMTGLATAITQAEFNSAEYDFENIHIRRGSITQNRYESLVDPGTINN